MTRVRKLLGYGLLAIVAGSLSVGGLSGKAFAADPDPMKLLQDCKTACDKVKDFTAKFSKRERMNDKLKKMETVNMKFRQRPFSVYMHWFEGSNKGREVIYHEGKYKGQVVGHQRVGPFNFSKKVKPKSREALKHSRRPVTMAGFKNAIKAIMDATEAGKKRNEVTLRYLGTEVFDNRPVHVIIRMFSKKRDDYPVLMGIYYIDKQYMLPVKIVGYDWDFCLDGLYVYKDVKINVGLKDSDFDITNKNYDFPRELLPRIWPFGGD